MEESSVLTSILRRRPRTCGAEEAHTIKLVGTFVLTKTIAPSFRSCWTIQDSDSAVSFFPSQPTYPRDVSVSLTRNWSFNDTGSP